MKINKEGLELIKSFEGCRLVAYDDLQPNKTITNISQVKGTLTIGYGHTVGVTVGMVINQTQADNMLKSDLSKYEKYVDQYVNIPLNENQFSALVSFCYNCGAGNLKTLVKNRDASQIADAILLYNKASGKVLNGLTRRRKAERELFLKGISNSYYPKYNGSSPSIVAGLQAVKVDSGYSYRKKIALANGINNYSGTAEQNTKLLNLLKEGKLIKA